MKIMDSYTIIEIDRNDIFRNAFNSIMTKSPQKLKRKLIIEYKGEEGIDEGGLLRYFFISLLLNIYINI